MLDERGDRRAANPGVGIGKVRLQVGQRRLFQRQHGRDARRRRLSRGRGAHPGPFGSRCAAAVQMRLLDRGHRVVRGQVIELGNRDEIRCHRTLHEAHFSVGTLVEIEVVSPLRVVAFRQVGTFVVEAPTGFGAGERGPGGHLGAVADERYLGGPHQLVWRAGADALDLGSHPLERLHRDRQFGRGLRRRHIVVDEPPQLELDLGLGRAVRLPQRPVDELVRRGHLVGGKLGRCGHLGQCRGGMFTGQIAVDERPDHVVVRHAGQIAGRIQPGYRGAGVLVHPHA